MKQFYGAVKGNFMEQCHAGHDPASHPIKGVGTQRVALAKQNEIAGQARKDTDSELFGGIRC